MPHEACFIGLDSDGIVRRTQRRVISQAWGGSDAPAAWARAEETLVPLPDDCSMTGPANRLADEAKRSADKAHMCVKLFAAVMGVGFRELFAGVSP